MLHKNPGTIGPTFLLILNLLPLLSVAQELDSLKRVSAQATDNAAWTPDGEHLLFTANFSGNWQVYKKDLGSQIVTRLTHHPGNDDSPQCSPNGELVLFSSERGGNQDVWIMNIDGSNQRKLLLSEANEMHPTWHPNGKEILFNSNMDDSTGIAIYRMDLQTEKITRLSDPKDTKTYAHWSPDGRKIAYAKWQPTPETRRDICVMDAGGSNELNLTNNPEAMNGWPSWSPDGQEVVFSARHSNTFQIFSVSKDGKSTRQLIKSEYDDRRATWHKDQTKLAFDRTVPGMVTALYVAVAMGRANR